MFWLLYSGSKAVDKMKQIDAKRRSEERDRHALENFTSISISINLTGTLDEEKSKKRKKCCRM